MLGQTLATALLLGVALTPALARDRHKDRDRDGDRRSVESVTDRIEALQSKLDDDLPDAKAQRIEATIDRLVDKYGIVLPPPVDPPVEPKELFKDDFSRDQTEVGNGWLGHDGSIELEHMRITTGGEMYRTVPLDEPQKTVTVSFDVVPDPNGSGDVVNQDVSMFWTEGDPAVTRQTAVVTEMSAFPDHTSYTFTTPEKVDNAGEPEPYTSFGFGFTTDLQSTAVIDNVVVGGVPFATSAFVGF